MPVANTITIIRIIECKIKDKNNGYKHTLGVMKAWF